jgi:hypothetical protein
MKTLNPIFALLLFAFIAACSPTGTPVREPVYIGQTEISATLTNPPSISLHITGDLPTACHTFNYEYEILANLQINVTVYSAISPAATCIQGLHAFDETIEIPMTGQPDGNYQVFLNENFVGEITLAN